jgi:predicted secreted protein
LKEYTSDLSSKCIFVSHCLLAQAVVARGLAQTSAAIVKPVVQFCMDNNINIFQMPCPEVECAAGGLGRNLHGKKWYEENGLREICSHIAKEQVGYMKKLSLAGCQTLAIVGVEFSPACAPTYLNIGRRVVRDKGIYIEELERELEEQELKVAFIGVNQRWLKKLSKQFNDVLVRSC